MWSDQESVNACDDWFTVPEVIRESEGNAQGSDNESEGDVQESDGEMDTETNVQSPT